VRNKTLRVAVILLLSLALLLQPSPGWSQGGDVLLIIQGEPDARSSPPQVQLWFSLVDRVSGASIGDLSGDRIRVLESGVPIPEAQINYLPRGLAVVAVIDLGGIAVPGDKRLREATDLVRLLTTRLNMAGTSTDDRITLVAVGKEGALTLEEMDPSIHEPLDFTYTVDKVAVTNTLTLIEGQSVQKGTITPLYEGLEKAIALLDEARSPTIQEILGHRRKVIFVFSDGGEGTSNDTTREIITRKARERNIAIYTVGLAKSGGSLSKEGERNLRILAADANGLFSLDNLTPEKRADVVRIFDQVATQRMQYQVTYTTHLRKGTYAIKIVADTPFGQAEASVNFSSILEPLHLTLSEPADGLQVEVPYSSTLGAFVPTQVLLQAQVAPADGVPRAPSEVRYFANGKYIGSGPADTGYAFAWEVASLVTVTGEIQQADFTLRAEADDPYLQEKVETPTGATIRVVWGTYPWWPEGFRRWLMGNWGFLAGYGVAAALLVFLVVMMIRTRGELARRIVQRTTGVMKGLTRLLTPELAHPWGKITVLQGSCPVREFLLTQNMVKFGRNPQFCDHPLYDEFVSNPHFTLFREGMEAYIQDEQSKNKTYVNGVAVPLGTRQLLPPGATIKVGMTLLRFEPAGTTMPQDEGATQDVPG